MKKTIVSVVIIGAFVIYCFLYGHAGSASVIPITAVDSRPSSSATAPASTSTPNATATTGATATPAPRTAAPTASARSTRMVPIRAALTTRNGEWCRSKPSLPMEKLLMCNSCSIPMIAAAPFTSIASRTRSSQVKQFRHKAPTLISSQVPQIQARRSFNPSRMPLRKHEHKR